jgi:hypothetical protein
VFLPSDSGRCCLQLAIGASRVRSDVRSTLSSCLFWHLPALGRVAQAFGLPTISTARTFQLPVRYRILESIGLWNQPHVPGVTKAEPTTRAARNQQHVDKGFSPHSGLSRTLRGS